MDAELTARGHLGWEMPSCKGGETPEAWAERTGRRRAAGHGRGGLRFAFYRRGDRGMAGPGGVEGAAAGPGRRLLAGHGRIVAEFFDTGYGRLSRRARGTRGG